MAVFREKLTKHQANRLSLELADKKKVEWVSGTYLTEEAVVFQNKKWGKTIGEIVIPYSEITDFGMLIKASSPTFALARKDGESLLQFGTGLNNFYPGLLLFSAIMQPFAADDTQERDA